MSDISRKICFTRLRRLIVRMGVALSMLVPGQADDNDHRREVTAKSGAKLELLFPKDTYRVGEPIEVTMRYSCANAEPPIAAWVVTYDRGGRIMDFGFRGTDADGKDVQDPLKYLLMSMGGLRGTAPVTPAEPYEQTVTVNEWLVFPEPGEYDIIGHSEILYETDAVGGHGPRFGITSAPRKITIIPADAEWQTPIVSTLREKLRGSPEDARAAMKSLRYLLDEQTIPLLIDGLSRSETVFDAFCGLASLPNPQKVRTALLKSVEKGLPPPPNATWAYSSLLANADILSEKLDRASQDEALQKQIRHIEEKWRAYFIAKATAAIDTLPPDKAAARLVDAMAIGGLREPTLEQKRIILQNAQSLDASRTPHVIDSACGNSELIPELSAVAADETVAPRIRSAAMVQLHKLGVETFRDAIAADLMAPEPILSTAAHVSLGSYGAEEIGKALVKKAQDKSFETRIKAAETLRNFGVGVSADQLIQLISNLRAKNQFSSPELVEALALASPQAVLPLLREILAGQVRSENDFRPVAVTLLSRLPNTQKEVRQELAADDLRRERMTQELFQSAFSNLPPKSLELSPSSAYRRIVPGDKDTVKIYAPDLHRLAASDPSDKVRTNAAMALYALTGIPAQTHGGRILSSQIPQYLPKWREWMDENLSQPQSNAK